MQCFLWSVRILIVSNDHTAHFYVSGPQVWGKSALNIQSIVWSWGDVSASFGRWNGKNIVNNLQLSISNWPTFVFC